MLVNAALFFFAASAAVVAAADLDSALVGTWSSKSNKTLTGPGFYNPVKDTIIEPALPGISYSFTSDGHFESALYRAVANPGDPNCPKGIIQWQHGSYAIEDSKVVLTPIKVDGRQLYSDPCNENSGVYTRYNQTTTFKKYEVVTDKYHNIKRLNLWEWDGTPVIPLYLAYTPPQMLPTTTLNPTGATASSTSSSKVKRADEAYGPIVRRMLGQPAVEHVDADRFWWLGLGATAIGSVLYFCF
ncbi:chaperone for protein-folding within the ER, fungal-domain-containing protein [Phyllosticta citribraziliensis]|uniref:Protein ROT1 n=1 Tax=Phyllosticta citribraziliensis TaxID=989973 RepID=A0ABR1M079_9PEZI